VAILLGLESEGVGQPFNEDFQHHFKLECDCRETQAMRRIYQAIASGEPQDIQNWQHRCLYCSMMRLDLAHDNARTTSCPHMANLMGF
jgi:hypothetical protein